MCLRSRCPPCPVELQVVELLATRVEVLLETGIPLVMLAPFMEEMEAVLLTMVERLAMQVKVLLLKMELLAVPPMPRAELLAMQVGSSVKVVVLLAKQVEVLLMRIGSHCPPLPGPSGSSWPRSWHIGIISRRR